jgi:hypothetical protein
VVKPGSCTVSFRAMPEPRDPSTHVRLAFVRDGRLVALPSRASYRLAALALLAERFVPGRDYPEREVNDILAADAPDPATLRRLLVDHGFMERAGGIYRRAE